jgi:hypothetical protein
MIHQLDNLVINSFIYWLDHTILKKGEAFTNVYSLEPTLKIESRYRFEGTPFIYNGAPLKGWVWDTSIPNAVIVSGIYPTTGGFLPFGSDECVFAGFHHGAIYSIVPMPISYIDVAVKDFNIQYTSKSEQDIIFNTKYVPSAKYGSLEDAPGLKEDSTTIPCIFVKLVSSNNQPFAFGGQDVTTFNIRAIVLSNTAFKLDAVCGILRDTVRTFVPYFDYSILPSLQNPFVEDTQAFNYEQLASTQADNEFLFISNVAISRYNSSSVIITEAQQLNPGVFPALVDFDIQAVRSPRAS